MKKLRNDFIVPILVLGLICLLCTWAVAVTFHITDPEIQRMNLERAQAARLEVLPEADEFIEFPDLELPHGVTEAFRANNGVGYVFQTYAPGYAGIVPVTVGLDPDGRIIGIRMLANQETRGIGDRVECPTYLALFYGLTSPDGVDTISGATVTVDALKHALRHAIEAFELVRDI
ncbi:MAG: FMN-binding protein [Oscillospiraceae bacterium]|nr:FMN-binding protein [Oscillospiraceae bacterium]